MNGRKRHLLVDTGGLVLKAVVHPANLGDREGAPLVLTGITERFPLLQRLWVDAGSTGKLVGWIERTLGLQVTVVKRPRRVLRLPPAQEPPPPVSVGFRVLPRRWVVERTFAWLGLSRRLSKDYETLPRSQEAMCYASMCRRMLTRLGRVP